MKTSTTSLSPMLFPNLFAIIQTETKGNGMEGRNRKNKEIFSSVCCSSFFCFVSKAEEEKKGKQYE
jgi:hypothetical protein